MLSFHDVRPFSRRLDSLHTLLPFRAYYARMNLCSYVIGNALDQGSRNAEGRLRFPSAAFRDVELNALNYRRSSTSRVAFGLPPRSLLQMEWAFVVRCDHWYRTRSHDTRSA